MLPAFDNGEHTFWVGGPYEGFGMGVGFFDEAVDGVLEVGDGAEDPRLSITVPCYIGISG